MPSATSDAATLLKHLGRARARIAVARFVRNAGWCCTAAALAGAAGLLSGTVPPSALWLAGPAALAAAAAGIALRYPTRHGAAALLDARLALDDRTIAALSAMEAADPFSRLIVRDAAARLSGLRVADVCPLRIDRPVACGAVSMAVLAGLTLIGGYSTAPDRASLDGNGEWRAVATPPPGATSIERTDTAAVRDSSPSTVASPGQENGDQMTTAEQADGRGRAPRSAPAGGDDSSPDGDTQRGGGSGTNDGAESGTSAPGALARDAGGRSQPQATAGSAASDVGSGAGVGGASATALAARGSGGIRAGQLNTMPSSSGGTQRTARAIAGARAARPLDARSLQDDVPPHLRRVVRDYFIGLAAADPE